MSPKYEDDVKINNFDTYFYEDSISIDSNEKIDN
jgi:uncharacterized protein YqkB